jgi:hypothetical protein
MVTILTTAVGCCCIVAPAFVGECVCFHHHYDHHRRCSHTCELWPCVPEEAGVGTSPTTTRRIMTRVKQGGTKERDERDPSPRQSPAVPWPPVVPESVMYGLSAENPRRVVVADEVNHLQQARLRRDIITYTMLSFREKAAVGWESAFIFPRGI